MPNYIKLPNSLFSCNYIFFDYLDHHQSFAILESKGVQLKDVTEYIEATSKFCVIFVKFKKKYEPDFLVAMEQLEDTLGEEYKQDCNQIVASFKPPKMTVKEAFFGFIKTWCIIQGLLLIATNVLPYAPITRITNLFSAILVSLIL